ASIGGGIKSSSISGGYNKVHLISALYNEVGQLVSKRLHNVGVSSAKQSVDYRYNIRGWLTGINDLSDNTDDLFQFDLRYNDPTVVGTVSQFNGNISQTTWRTAWGDELS